MPCATSGSGDMKSTILKVVTDKVMNNKLYIMILIFVVVLGVGLYIYFIKNKSKLDLLKNLCVKSKSTKKVELPSCPHLQDKKKKPKIQHPQPLPVEQPLNDSSDKLEEYDEHNIDDSLMTMQQLTNSELKEIEEELSSS